MGDFLFDPMVTGMQQVLDLRSRQHAITAGNLANADTPGFKAKQMDFRESLSAAVSNQGAPMRVTDARHMGGVGGAQPEISEIDPAPWATDDNSVYIEREMARLQENALMYRAVAQGMSRRLGLLKYAASDGGQ